MFPPQDLKNFSGPQITRLFGSVGIPINHNFQDLGSAPSIILANYCKDRCENALSMLIPTKLAILMGGGFKKVSMDNIINRPIWVRGRGNFKYISQEIRRAIDDGISVFAYINKASHLGYRGNIRSGLIRIALQWGIPITPISFDTIKCNRIGAIIPQNYNIRIGPLIRTKGPLSPSRI